MRPPPPTATSTVSIARRLPVELAGHRPLAGDDERVVVRVHEQRAGLGGRAVAASWASWYTAPPTVTSAPRARMRATLAGALDRGHEDLGPVPEGPRHVGDGDAVVAAGCGDHPGRPAPCAASTRLNAPRGLNEPACCSSSSLSVERHRRIRRRRARGPAPASPGHGRRCGARPRRCRAAVTTVGRRQPPHVGRRARRRRAWRTSHSRRSPSTVLR